ncbi:Gfo/Idh/MocA family protein [Actinopolymorpha singaporensis]|uniref:Predicted dehydrogenase n=1 Tax=Actinopolymorpha singaporensis TaxID=117157 RepID=A0A1H1LVK5_9ACTN|nr:Gfo/Idh/MocA family oxidoreductase [Actinopolymorpha singaporensis]SDR78457.1 Predicted dehydrogenase [Actinopolymorpha singaporensis]
MRALRAGLLGLGMMGRHHARVLRSLDGVELVAVADPGGDPHGVAGGLDVLPDVEKLVTAGIDLCVVAVPTAFHEEVGLVLAAAGVHALVEKPLASTVEGAEKLAAAFEAQGLVGCVGHIERYNPALQALRGRLDHGELGEIYQVITRRQGPFPNRIADVGVTKDLATHDIDSTAWVTRGRYLSVSARTAHKSGREYEDLVAVVGQLDDGTVVNHLVNWLSPMKERVTVVTGERGAFVADTIAADLTFHANGLRPLEWETMASFRGVTEGDMIRYAIPKPEPLRTELTAFRDAILRNRDGAGPDLETDTHTDADPSTGGGDVVGMREGLAIVEVAEAILRSAAQGRTVGLG